ncbi:3beta-hydroxysteroid-dehydrogenase/decarboxylase isoform [Dorcoceras hygrometricum]|uniref:3beta-hydroxysteroid-dehydrogenase/decarboxylase isoform n=1 Tax=Dorcoceras hygrometricum TaxID=472368 RepID=A0A2Z7BMY0_9LAMI|nr:3beta-hydroxysteroid-dehydrogenase/decarboxylase isoform [Dorcoceras hygrometricum]
MRSVVASHGPGSNPSTCVTLNGSGIQLAVVPQPLRLRNHDFGLAQWIMVKRLATSRHDPLGITDSACKNQLVVIAYDIHARKRAVNPRQRSIDSYMHRDLTQSRRLMTPMRTNQYNQDLGIIHSTNGNHLEIPNEGSSIDHQVTIHLHAQNITMFPTNETCLHTSHSAAPPLPQPHAAGRRLAPPRAAAVCRHLRDQTCFDHRDEEFPSVLNSSVLLVQADEGVLITVVDLIRRIYRRLQSKSQISLRILVGARRLDAIKPTLRKSLRGGAAGCATLGRNLLEGAALDAAACGNAPHAMFTTTAVRRTSRQRCDG